MFHPDVTVIKRCFYPTLKLSGATAMSVSAALVIATYLERPAAASRVEPAQSKAKPGEIQKDAGRPDGDGSAERKLLVDLETAIATNADYIDYSRLERELAAAFRGFGLDLDVIDPKTAGARLARRAPTPEIAAVIDRWCRVRKTRLRVATWRRLAEVARAADPDAWRNAMRDEYDRPPADALPALKACVADAQALEKQPVNSLLLLSQMLVDANERPLAAAVLQIAKRRFPGDFWVCLLQGTMAIAGAPNPDPTEAARACTAAVALRPQSPLAHMHLGVALHLKKKLAEAAAEMREAIRLTPDNADAHVALGYAMAQIGKHDEAASRYRQAIRLKPRDAQLHSYLGLALSAQSKHDEALTECREATRLEPDDAEVQLALGIALEHTDKLDEAIRSYRVAVRLRPRDSKAHFYLGVALSKLREHDEAVTVFREAIELKPDDAMSHFCLGFALQRARRLDDAIGAFREAIRLKPDYASAHYNLGVALREQGNLEDAEDEFAEAKRLGRAVDEIP
jgi:Flp pilus assembly protein TadD